MLYHIKHITFIAVVGIMLCMAMAACSDSNAEDAIAMNDVRVAFTVAVSDVKTTRAANEDGTTTIIRRPALKRKI